MLRLVLLVVGAALPALLLWRLGPGEVLDAFTSDRLVLHPGLAAWQGIHAAGSSASPALMRA
jgi:hypothetical protein